MTFEKVAKIIAEHISKDVSEITMDQSFEDLGLDSLDTVDIIMALEEEFGKSIEMDPPVKTIAELVALLDGGK